MGYGHQFYLDKLQSDRDITIRALEHVQRRVVEVVHKQQNWLQWIEECQEEEEKKRENAQKRVKKEAALFKRHWKELEARTQEKRRIENEKMEEEFLNKAYKERMTDLSDLDAAEWDPIEDTVEVERESYIEIMKRLLWLPSSTPQQNKAPKVSSTTRPDTEAMTFVDGARSEGGDTSALSKGLPASTSNSPSNAKKKAKKARAKAAKIQQDLPKVEDDHRKEAATTIMNDTKEETRARLIQGQEHDPFAGVGKRGGGCLVAGTLENPHQTMGKTAGLSAEEAEKLLNDVSEIRLLLFCRLLLSHATLLPFALQANSVDEFFNNKSVNSTNLRDLCLRIEQPSLQEVRDACADLNRADEAEDEGNSNNIVPAKHEVEPWWAIHKKSMPRKWKSKQEKAIKKHRAGQQMLRPQAEDPGVALHFGVIDNRVVPSKKVKIKICGKTIWNYPSEKTMARGGWLHWTIMTKDGNLFDAIKLCRNWNEFWELNVLAIFRYFPSAHYVTWNGDRSRQQWLQLVRIALSLL